MPFLILSLSSDFFLFQIGWAVSKLRVEAGETYYFGTRSNHERPFQLTDQFKDCATAELAVCARVAAGTGCSVQVSGRIEDEASIEGIGPVLGIEAE